MVERMVFMSLNQHKRTIAREDTIYFPLISTPFGKVPLIAATMTDEREREIARKYPAKVAGKAV